MDELSTQVMAQCYLILPMLNRGKTGQAALHKALDLSLAFVNDCFARKTLTPLLVDTVAFAVIKRSAFDALEEIGKKVWDKVQDLK